MTKDQTLRADAQRNYDRLIKAAESVFAAKGAGAPLDAIAKEAEVGIGTLYRHFPTRKALLEAVYQTTLEDLSAEAHTLLKSAPSAENAMLSWLHTTVENVKKYGGFGDLLALIGDDQKSPLVIDGSKLLTKAQKEGSLRDDISIIDLFQLLNSVVASEGRQAEADAKRVKRLLDVVFSGLKVQK